MTSRELFRLAKKNPAEGKNWLNRFDLLVLPFNGALEWSEDKDKMLQVIAQDPS
jgi:hypothetical protein